MAKLNEARRKKLDEYLEEKKGLIQKTPSLTTAELAQWCREAGLGEIDTGNITHRVGPKGTIFIHEWPGSEQSRKGRLTDRLQKNIIIEQIELFRVQMCRVQHQLNAAGVVCPGLGAAVPMWADLVEQMKNDLADTDHREDEEKSLP